MLGETKNQFSLTRAALSTDGRPKSNFRSVRWVILGVFLASPVLAQPLRQFGTNLYDLSAVMNPALPNNPYRLEGKAAGNPDGKLMLIHADPPRRRVVLEPSGRTISAGEFLAVPELRPYIHAVEEQNIYALTVAHYPESWTFGQKLTLYALPVCVPGASNTWDYGEVFRGDPATFDSIIRVYPQGMFREKLHPSARPAAKPDSPTIESQASNGVAAAQFRLGLRYLDEDSTNRQLGYYWLYKAAYQNFPPATNYLNFRRILAP